MAQFTPDQNTRGGNDSASDPFRNLPAPLTDPSLQAAFLDLADRFPFRPEYVGRIDPFTERTIRNEADYLQFLREYLYASVCEQAASGPQAQGQTGTAQPLNLVLTGTAQPAGQGRGNVRKAPPVRSAQKKQGDSSKGPGRKLRAGVIVLLLLAVCGLIGLPGLRQKAYDAGYEAGLAAAQIDRNSNSQTEPYTVQTDDTTIPEETNESVGTASPTESAAPETSVDSRPASEPAEPDTETAPHLPVTEAPEMKAPTEPTAVTDSAEPETEPPPDRTLTEPPEPPAAITYIGNKNSKKFHLPTCSSLPAEKNQVYFQSRDEAVREGYEPCKRCNP